MAEELKRCDCGTWSPCRAAYCSACGAQFSEARDPDYDSPAPELPGTKPPIAGQDDSRHEESEVPECQPMAEPLPTRLKPTVDSASGARMVARQRAEDLVVGIALLVFGLMLLFAPGMWPFVVVSMVSGTVNCALAYALRPGNARVYQAHRWLSYLGLIAGGVVILALFAIQHSQTHGSFAALMELWGWETAWILSLFVIPILLFPVRALLALRRAEVKAFLGVHPDSDRTINLAQPGATTHPLQSTAPAAIGTVAAVTTTAATVGCGSSLVLVLILQAMLGAIATLCVWVLNAGVELFKIVLAGNK